MYLGGFSLARLFHKKFVSYFSSIQSAVLPVHFVTIVAVYGIHGINRDSDSMCSIYATTWTMFFDNFLLITKIMVLKTSSLIILLSTASKLVCGLRSEDTSNAWSVSECDIRVSGVSGVTCRCRTSGTVAILTRTSHTHVSIPFMQKTSVQHFSDRNIFFNALQKKYKIYQQNIMIYVLDSFFLKEHQVL